MKRYKRNVSTITLLVLVSVFTVFTVLYAVQRLGTIGAIETSSASSAVGDFIGICAGQIVKDQIYVKYETFQNTISRVDFYIDNNKVRSEQQYPYALAGNAEDSSQTLIPFDTKSLSNGSHTLRVQIITDKNQYTDSVNFIVANNNPSQTFNQFQGVCDKQTVNGQMYIQYNADPSNTNAVTFEVTNANGYKHTKTERVSPYGLNGNLEPQTSQETAQILPFNASALNDGTYQLKATITDKSNRSTTKIISFDKKRSFAPPAQNPPPTPTSPSPSPKASNTPKPSASGHHSPQPPDSNPPTGSLPFPKVDPNSTTDNQINQFLKDTLRNSDPKKLIGGGGWWGPLDKFFVNQLWTVNRTAEIGKVFQSGGSQTTSMSCFLPGFRNTSGLSRNFLGDPRNIKSPTPYAQTHYGVRADGIGSTLDGTRGQIAGTWVTNTSPIPSGYDSFVHRTRCETKEGVANVFGDGSPILNDDLRTILEVGQWKGRAGIPSQAQFNHSGLPLKYDSLISKTWYSKEGYVLLVVDGAEQIHNGRTTNLSNKDLVGSRVRGTLRIRMTSFKGGSLPSLGATIPSSSMPIHHQELRIEQNNEDYTVARRLGTVNLSRQWTNFDLDTTKVSEGWHVLSVHTHAIDKGNPAPYFDKQSAVEVKFFVCVDNDNKNDCAM